jgi:hypothetical protein
LWHAARAFEETGRHCSHAGGVYEKLGDYLATRAEERKEAFRAYKKAQVLFDGESEV